MIPDLPEGISNEALLKFYDTLLGNLQDQSSIHINWFTHRGNPSVCWICDLGILSTKILDICNRLLTKSTVDLETVSLSENESDSEIDMKDSEESLNYDEENTPEYEVEE